MAADLKPEQIAELVLAAQLVIDRLGDGAGDDEAAAWEQEPIALLADGVQCLVGAMACLLESVVAQWRAGYFPKLTKSQVEALQLAEQITGSGNPAAESE